MQVSAMQVAAADENLAMQLVQSSGTVTAAH